MSVDPVESHEGWVGDINETQGTTVNFPMIADPDRTVADLYGMIHPNASDTMTVRSVFVIGPDKKVKLTHHLPGEHRAQLRGDPAGPRLPAADRQVPGLHAGGLEGRRRRDHRPGHLRRRGQGEVPQGVDAKRPYLRLTPQPNK